MSTKICVTAVRPTWKDAVTIGQLNQIIEGLYALGFDDDTPVTYLYDERHVWLETVHDVDDDGFDIEVEREPGVVDELGAAQQGTDWIDDDGDLWRWRGKHKDGGWQYTHDHEFMAASDWEWYGDETPTGTFGPFTEIP